jgi:FMN-dependent oxidoreductase (nitrilotriacetate monooxygenase family)
MHLNVFLAGTGHHEASWRHPAADPVLAATGEHYISLAETAERACLDSVFVADGLSVAVDLRHSMPRNFEPISLLGAIAARTQAIGLIGTMSTSYTEPFNLARQFASLDHLSHGRAGWNIVTTAEGRSALNFSGASLPSHEERYSRAAEFVTVVKKLWDSWDQDAIDMDPDAGVFADPNKIHEVAHVGDHFQIAGPLNIARSPQRTPSWSRPELRQSDSGSQPPTPTCSSP